MIYYRLAVQDRQSAHWTWKTPAVYSLQSVLLLLSSYWLPLQDGIRVFTASSEEELSEKLSRENNHLASDSVTATQFLQARYITGGEQAQSAEASGVAASPLHEHLATESAFSSLGMSFQKKKCLELESGPGGDHDTPYSFTLPVSISELLAWTRLQTRVKAGELEP